MSSISCGIVGLPNAGKSTLFNALTKNNVLVANYPFATIEPNTGVVAVPDDRLKVLSDIYHSDKIVPASVTFIDIAGLVAGASHGEGLGNQFLGHIRSTNAIAHVVRDFDNGQVSHVNSSVNPKQDIDIINTELILADLQTLQHSLSRFEKEARADPSLAPKYKTLVRVQELLNNGKPIFSEPSIDHEHISDLQLITAKPMLYVFNVDEANINKSEHLKKLSDMVAPAQAVFICAKIENELNDLDEPDAREFLASYGQKEPGLNQLIKAAYQALGLQSFLTAGPKEVRAWTTLKGSTAQQAAGVIHSDFARGFISAEIVNYPDLVKNGSLQAARSAGQVRTEGKAYIMQPEDVVEFRFNV